MGDESHDVRVSPGKEDDFRFLQRQYAASAAVERLIEATETENPESRRHPGETDRPLSGASDTVAGEEVQVAMWANEYIAEKTRQLNSEELDRALRTKKYVTDSRSAGGFTRFVAATGRSMRRVGQRLESWGTLEDPNNCTSC